MPFTSAEHEWHRATEVSMDANGDRFRDSFKRFWHFLSIIGGKKLTSKTEPVSITTSVHKTYVPMTAYTICYEQLDSVQFHVAGFDPLDEG